MRRAALLVAGLAVALAGATAAAWRLGWILPSVAAVEDPVAALTGLPRRDAVVWAVGDGADGSRRAIALADRIERDRPDLFLYLGDVYGGRGVGGVLERDGGAGDFAEGYDPVYGALARRTVPTPGNHEWARRDQGYRPYWRGVTGRVPADFSAVHVAGWEVLSLNSEADHGAGSAQLRWLRARVARPGTCRLAIVHRPRFSAGPHGDQPDLAPLWAALRGRAVLVLSGHDHDLQRFRPIDGLTQLVVGAGGRALEPLRPDRRLAWGDDEHDGALRLRLRPGAARFAFVATGGRVLDRGRATCTPVSAR